MSASAKKITQTFNGRAEWNVGGGAFFKLLASVNPVDVELYNSGRQVLLAPQADSGFYQRIAFDRVVLTTGALEPVSFLVAPDEGGSDTFSGVVSGTIDVTDRGARLLGTLTAWPGKNRLYSPGYLFGTAVGAVAAQNGFVRLLNPAASGVRIFVDRIHFAASVASVVDLRSGVAIGVLNPAPMRKDTTQAAAAGQVYSAASGAVGGTAHDTWMVSAADGGGGARTFEEPLILQPGESLTVVNVTVNESIRAGFEWREGV